MPDEPPTAEPPHRRAYQAYYGTGYAGTDFRGIGSELLKTFPPLAPPVPTLPAIDPTAAGFGVHGPHLLAPLLNGAGGSPVSPCPVCRTVASVARSAGGWVPLWCASCGTEFVATDGTAPPPPAPPPPSPPPPAAPAGALWRKLELWVASGEPARWVAHRRGEWGEGEFSGLIESLRFTEYWPVNPVEVRQILNAATDVYRREMARTGPAPVSVFTSPIFVRADGRRVARCPVCAAEVAVPTSAAERVPTWCPFCGTEFVAVSPPAPRPPAPAPKPALPPPPTPVLPRSKVHTLALGLRYARCPVCRASDLPILRSATGEVRLKCPACGAVFLADVPGPTPPRPLPTPPPPRSRLWDTIRVLIGLASPVLIVMLWVLLDRLVKSIWTGR